MQNELVVVAQKISEVYEIEGQAGLRQWLINFGLEADIASLVSENYQLKKIDWSKLQNQTPEFWKEVWKKGNFDELGLQLKSISDKPTGVWPKNLLGWILGRKINPNAGFDFHIPASSCHAKKKNRIDFTSAHQSPFLVALDIGTEDLPPSIINKSKILVEELGVVGKKLALMMLKHGIIFPPEPILRRLAQTIKQSLCNGTPIILTGAFCPDYEYRLTGKTDVPYEYTFKNVGENIGLVAQQFLRLTPVFFDFFQEHDIDCKVVFGIGDFEANNQEILSRVNLSFDAFVERCKKSAVSFQNSLYEKHGIEIEVRLCQEEWIGKKRWQDYIEYSKNLSCKMVS